MSPTHGPFVQLTRYSARMGHSLKSLGYRYISSGDGGISNKRQRQQRCTNQD